MPIHPERVADVPMFCNGADGFDLQGSDDHGSCRKIGMNDDTPYDLSYGM